jgi:hypothetical protein
MVIGIQLLVVGPSAGEDVAAGAGASALACVLPLEHALVALSLSFLAPGAALAPAVTAMFALALGGFAVHASHDHQRLARAGFGHPHYEPDLAREYGATHGLLFLDDDEAFALAHDPAMLASHGLEAVRERDDDHDRLLYDLLGHPQTHRYKLGTSSTVAPWAPGGGDSWRFEAESDFPPVVAPDPRDGHTSVIDATGSGCPGREMAVEVAPAGEGEVRTVLELPVPRGSAPAPAQSWTVTPRVYQRGGAGAGSVAVVLGLDAASQLQPLAEWTWTDAARAPTCSDLPSQSIELGGGRTRAWLVVTARGGSVALDRTTLRGH